MAGRIIPLPTAAESPIGPQPHRGSYPKKVVPKYRLDYLRKRRQKEVEASACGQGTEHSQIDLPRALAALVKMGKLGAMTVVFRLSDCDHDQVAFWGAHYADRQQAYRALMGAAFDVSRTLPPEGKS